MKKDNSTLAAKVSLRHRLLSLLSSPVVLETHGGTGRIGLRCYGAVERGVVFEKDPAKAEHLAVQRPTWAVYEADCLTALAAGVGAHLPINLVDLDPYGEPWPVLDALFRGPYAWPDTLGIVVNDGLRQKLRLSGGWDVHSMQGVVARYGNGAMHDNYLSICQELLQEKAAQVGYSLSRWTGYYTGYGQQMTHYAALLVRSS